MANQFANIKPPDLVAADRNGIPPTGKFILIRRISAIAPLELLVQPRPRWFDVRYLATTVALFHLPDGDIANYPEAFRFIYHQDSNTVAVELSLPEAEVHRPSDMDDDILLFASVLETRINDFGVSGATAGIDSGSSQGAAFSVRQILIEEVRLVLRLMLRRILLHAYTPLRSRIHFTDPVRARAAEQSANQHADDLTQFLIPRNDDGFVAPRDFPQIGEFPTHTAGTGAGGNLALSIQSLQPFDILDLRRVFWFASSVRGRLITSRDSDDAAVQYGPELSGTEVISRFTPEWQKAIVIQNVAAAVFTNEDDTLQIYPDRAQTFPILGSVRANSPEIIYYCGAYNTVPAEMRYEDNTNPPRQIFTSAQRNAIRAFNSPDSAIRENSRRRFRFRWGQNEFELRERFDITQSTILGSGRLPDSIGRFSQNVLPEPPRAGDLLFPIIVGDDQFPEIIGPPIALRPTAPPITEIGVSQFFENNRLYRFPFSGDLLSDLARGSDIFRAQTGEVPAGTDG